MHLITSSFLFCFFFSSRRRHTRSLCDWSSDVCFFFSSRRRHTRSLCDWSSDVCSSDLELGSGTLDLVLDIPITVSDTLRQKPLFSDRVVVMARKGHPAIGDRKSVV